MRPSKAQTVVALLLLMASSYCALECVVQPCHETFAARHADVPPPCHQHSKPQPQDKAAPSCLHSQFVMGGPEVTSASADLALVPFAAILPVECSLPVWFGVSERAIAAAVSPLPPPELELSAILRV